MKRDVAKKWIKALRSGKYKQTTSALKDANGYCCLGVLCEISKQGKFDSDNQYLNHLGFLPAKVIKWAGLNGSKQGRLPKPYKAKEGREYYTLAALNDNGLSFRQIARIIEHNIDAL